jgi:hypothetical protein
MIVFSFGHLPCIDKALHETGFSSSHNCCPLFVLGQKSKCHVICLHGSFPQLACRASLDEGQFNGFPKHRVY